MLDERTGGYNKTGIALAAIATYELMKRPSYTKPSDAREGTEATSDSEPKNTTGKSQILKSVALGSLLFSLHLFLTDACTLIAWTWTGYPIRGPVPHIHGAYTILAQAFGLLLPFLHQSTSVLATSPLWFLFGSTSLYVLYSQDDWTGYFGGLGVTIFLMSIIPQVVVAVADVRFTGRAYFVAFFVAILLYLANVWTVAYAFVPGGVYLRERTDL